MQECWDYAWELWKSVGITHGKYARALGLRMGTMQECWDYTWELCKSVGITQGNYVRVSGLRMGIMQECPEYAWELCKSVGITHGNYTRTSGLHMGTARMDKDKGTFKIVGKEDRIWTAAVTFDETKFQNQLYQ